VNQLFSPSKGKPKSLKSSMTSVGKLLAMDLLDLQKFQISGYKYLFNAIDMSSRFLYSVALKNKTDAEVLNGFKKIYNQSKTHAVRSDNVSEFINQKFTDY